MKKIQTSLVVIALGLFLAGAAQAQIGQGTAVTQSASRADAATFLYGMGGAGGPGVVTGCNTASATAAQDTVTIPAISGLSIYITGFYATLADANATGTGVASYTVSTTNLTGGPFWDFSTVTNTTGANGRVVAETYPTGLKATTPGTNVTFVPSGAMDANHYLCMRVAGFYAP
jgi:hypothetical protein